MRWVAVGQRPRRRRVGAAARSPLRHLERAQRAFAEMESRHDARAVSGRIHPSWLGRFSENHRIVELEDGHYPEIERRVPKEQTSRVRDRSEALAAPLVGANLPERT